MLHPRPAHLRRLEALADGFGKAVENWFPIKAPAELSNAPFALDPPFA
jgi:hypothetical protein